MNISDLSSRISIFGATGFIGSRFLEMYKEECVHQPRSIDCPYSNKLLYLISTTDNYNIHDNIKLDAETNIIKLLGVLQNCKNPAFEINFVSSWFVYGIQDTLPVKEDAICRPTGFYSITKKAAEDLLISFCRTYKVPYRIFRLSNIFGDDSRASKKKNALHYIVKKLELDEPVDLYIDPIIRDYLFVDDACKAMHNCMGDPTTLNQVINIGSGVGEYFQNLIKRIAIGTLSKSKINYIPTPVFHDIVQTPRMVLDVTKIKKYGDITSVTPHGYYTHFT